MGIILNRRYKHNIPYHDHTNKISQASYPNIIIISYKYTQSSSSYTNIIIPNHHHTQTPSYPIIIIIPNHHHTQTSYPIRRHTQVRVRSAHRRFIGWRHARHFHKSIRRHLPTLPQPTPRALRYLKRTPTRPKSRQLHQRRFRRPDRHSEKVGRRN